MKEIKAEIRLDVFNHPEYAYATPAGMVFSKSKQEQGNSIPITYNGNTIGFAVTGFYAVAGELYDNKDDAYNNPYYQGEQAEPYNIACKIAAIQQQQEDDDCCGD